MTVLLDPRDMEWKMLWRAVLSLGIFLKLRFGIRIPWREMGFALFIDGMRDCLKFYEWEARCRTANITTQLCWHPKAGSAWGFAGWRGIERASIVSAILSVMSCIDTIIFICLIYETFACPHVLKSHKCCNQCSLNFDFFLKFKKKCINLRAFGAKLM